MAKIQFDIDDEPGRELEDTIDESYIERREQAERQDSPLARLLAEVGIEDDLEAVTPERMKQIRSRLIEPELDPLKVGELPPAPAPSPAAPTAGVRTPGPPSAEAQVAPPGLEELFIGEQPSEIGGVPVLPGGPGELIVDVAAGVQRGANALVSSAADFENFLNGVADLVQETLPDTPAFTPLKILAELVGGVGPFTLIDIQKRNIQGAPVEEVQGLFDRATKLIESAPQIRDPKSIVGGLVSGFAQFLPAFIPAFTAAKGSQAMQALAKTRPLTAEVLSAAGAGAVADFLIFDPDDPRISGAVNKGLGIIERRLAQNGIEVDLQSQFLEWLGQPVEIPEGASEFERSIENIKSRLKNVVEGAIIGTIFDGLLIGFRTLKNWKSAKNALTRLNRAQTAALGERGAAGRGPTGTLPPTEGPFPTIGLGQKREVLAGQPETAVRDVTVEGGASHMLLSTDPDSGRAFISGASTLPTERGKGLNKKAILAAINEGERATGEPVLLGHPRVTGETLTPLQRKNFATLEREGFMVTEILDEARPDRRVAGLTDKGKRSIDPVFRAAADVPDLTTSGGGATYNAIDGNLFGKERFSVSIFPEWTREVDHVDGAVIREYMEQVQRGGTFGGEPFKQPFPEILTDARVSLGTWRDKDTGKTVLDIVVTPKNMDEAMALGRTFNQKEIFDLRPGVDDAARSISTGGDGTVPQGLLEEAPMDRFQRVIGETSRGEQAFTEALEDLAQETRAEIKSGEIRAVRGKPGTIPFNDAAKTKLANLGAGHIAAKEGPVDFHAWSKSFLEEFPPDERGFLDSETMDKLFAQSRTAFEREYNKAVRTFVANRKALLENLGEGADLPKGLDEAFAFPTVSRLMELFRKGEFLKDWYEGATDEIIKFYGKEDGRVFARLLAALSPQTSPPENVVNAMNAFKTWKANPNDLDAIGKAAKQISEAGVSSSNIPNLRRALVGEELSGPKVTRFLRAIMGDPDAVTPDRWMGRIFGFSEQQIDENAAQFMETWVRIEARKMGVAPREFQAAMWTGVKQEAGLKPTEILEPFRKTIQKNLDVLGIDFPPGLDQAGKITLATNWILARTMVGAAIGAWTGDTMEERITNGLIGAGLVNVPAPVIKLISRAVTKDAIDSAKKPLRRSFNRGPRAAAEAGADAGSPHMLAAWRLRETSDQWHREVERMKRGKITREETEKLAENILAENKITAETLNDLMPGAIQNSEEIVATTILLARSGEQLRSLSQIVAKNPTDADAVREMMKQLYVHGQIDPKRLGVITELGRAVGALNEPASGMNRFLKQFESLFSEARGGRTPEDIARMIGSFDSLEQSAVFARTLSKPSLVNAWLELWVNSLLWGPKTHMANLASNTAFLAWSVPERGTAALFRAGREGGVAPGEAGALLFGYMGSIQDAWRIAAKAFKEDMPSFGRAKLEVRTKHITGENLNVSGPAGKAVDFLGEAVRLSGRGLLAGDEFFKAIVFRGELRALAYREAYDTVIREGLEEAAAMTRMREIMNQRMADPPGSMIEKAQNAALYQTFTNELSGIGADVQKIARHPFGRFVLPFVRTPVNIAKATVERTPLGLALPSVRKNLFGKAPAEQQLAAARLALGSMTMASIGMLTWNGFVTGTGPTSPNLKNQWIEAGNEPESFRLDLDGDGVPDTPWINYGRLEPIGSMMSLAASMAEILADIPDGDDDSFARAEEIIGSMIQAVAKVIGSKTFLLGLSRMANVLANPGRFAGAESRRIIASLLPFSSALRQVTSAIEPELKEIRTAQDALKASLPGFSSSVPPRRNLFGDPISKSSVFEGFFGFLWNLASPINVKGVTDKKSQRVYQDIFRLNKTLGRNPAPTLPRHIEDINLEPEERDRWSVLMGQEVKIAGKDLKEQLFIQVNDPVYQRQPDEIQFALVSNWIRVYKEQARIKLLQEFSILDRSIRAAREEKIKSRLAPREEGVQ